MKLNAIHLKFQNNDIVDDNVIDVDVVVNCLSCRVRHAPRTRVPAVNGAGDAETSTASPATPRRLCRTNAALLQPYSAVSPPTSPAAAAAAAATGTTSPPPTAYWQWAWHLPQTSPVSTRGDEEDDLDDDGVTFDDAVQALLTASELVARAARIIERKRFSLM